MKKEHFETIYLVGIALKQKTSNKNEKAMADCGQLWNEFEKGQYYTRILEKAEEKLYAVYFDYDGDYTQPYSYFIGCRVEPGTIAPEGMENLVIPPGNYTKITAKGPLPNCVAEAWRGIWKSDILRDYRADFEVYDERSHDMENAEVDIFIGV